MVALQPRQPGALCRPVQPALAFLGEREIVGGVPAADRGLVHVRIELLQRERADGLQHRDADFAVHVGLPHQALFQEREHPVHHVHVAETCIAADRDGRID